MRIAPSPTPDSPAPWASGVAPLDAALHGGMARGCVHEVYAADAADVAAATGFALGVATGFCAPAGGLLWLRTRRAVRGAGVLQAPGWAEMGGMPGPALVGVVGDDLALLRAAVDGLRCAALSAVVVESWGAMKALDLTASRRLVLAAERSGVPLLLLRSDASPVPSAARTRWQVAAATSAGLEARAPGAPTFDVTLLRQRSGPCGQSWRVEWDRDQRMFREAPLSGAVVSVPADRPAAQPPVPLFPQRHAA
ncbi:hypothetical protein GTZ99_10420 [Novosphingobium sp. FSY-8]|uniref:Protein ImuA n=1 Tax=Novosphingobium ovatum TaxID=1908523 RepID=A0ABW9XEJ9_9SPHN|nr:hypothetical protein [Novosphingobium ovatum]NBC36970.1 hypothetical protein [Novosphingobium ovatum]